MTKAAMTRRTLVGTAVLAGIAPALAEQPRDIVVAVSSTSLGASGPRIANEMGLFREQGLAPRFAVMESGNAGIAALLSGSVPFALSGPGEIVAVRARGQKLVYVANCYAGLAGTLILSKAAVDKLGVPLSAPPAERLKALGGLVIASPSATSVYTLGFKIAAARSGSGQIRFTYMAQPAMAAALESGAIQGYIAGAPFWAPPVMRGVAVPWASAPKHEVPDEALPSSSTCLVCTQDFAESNRDLIQKARAGVAAFGKAIEQRPSDVKAAVLKLFPEVDAATLDLLYPAEAASWNAPPFTLKDVERDIAFIKAGGVQVPDINKLDPSVLLIK